METQEKYCDDQFKVLSCGDYKLPTPLQEAINKIAQKEGYISHKSFNRSISTSGGNFLADLYTVDIKGKTIDGDKETNIFIKNKLEDTVSIIDVDEAYSVETFFYRELSKLYDSLQNKANIPIEERYTTVKSFDASNPDAIILENLAKKGFNTCHRMEVVPLKFAELSIKQLARFHGLSWVLEKQYPNFFTKHIKTLKTPFIFNDDYEIFFKNMANYSVNIVEGDLKLSLIKFLSGALDKMKAYFDKNTKSVTTCLCHGDFRANNILMKNHNDDVTEVIPVDYQLLYYGCPIMDLIYFIFPCTDQPFRQRHLNDLKNLYYVSLTKFLTYFDIDVETVFPRHEFEVLYKERLVYGLIVSLLLTPILFTDDNDIPDFSKDEIGDVTVTPDPKMDERLLGLVDDFRNWGIL